MEIKNKFDFKIKRRKLFLSAGTGAAAYLFNKFFPFHFNGKNLSSDKVDFTIKLNPNAVGRNKTGKNNV
jgi:hypothetical protein